MKKKNIDWLEDKKEEFTQALAEENIELAEDIIQEVKQKGYERDALTLKSQLSIFKHREYE